MCTVYSWFMNLITACDQPQLPLACRVALDDCMDQIQILKVTSSSKTSKVDVGNGILASAESFACTRRLF